MRYVLRETVGSGGTYYYVYSDNLICQKLKNAVIFNSISEISDFKEDKPWTATYETIVVTDVELFKAKLSDT